MKGPYPQIQPYDRGMVEVGDGNRVCWETCGNPCGKPVVVVHGGPGSGCMPWHRTMFDPTAYRIVLFDQRGCGGSTPHAGEPDVDLRTNTTQNLVADMERLRKHLRVHRWLVWGGVVGEHARPCLCRDAPRPGLRNDPVGDHHWPACGVPLAVQRWPRPAVSGAVDRFRASSGADHDSDIVDAYSQLLHDSDPAVCLRAVLAWCTWESATPEWPPMSGLDERYRDPDFALAFARLVAHYARHNALLEDGVLLGNVCALAGIPAVLVNGRFDLQAPIGNAWELHRVWPRTELVIVEDAGHAGDDAKLTQELALASDRFAGLRERRADALAERAQPYAGSHPDRDVAS